MLKRGEDHHLNESLEDKKDRLFKWNLYQNVKLTQDLIKDSLIENLNVLRFLNMFETFNKVLIGWGSNQSLQLGLYLKKELSKFYKATSESISTSRMGKDQILQDIITLQSRMALRSEQQSNQKFDEKTQEENEKEYNSQLSDLIRELQSAL